MKYYDAAIVFQEVPDEITLAIDITQCPHKCVECHSPWLREDIGEVLDQQKILELIDQNRGISCICFMGGDASHQEIRDLTLFIHANTTIKVAMYSGDDKVDQQLVEVLDYYKIGSYQKNRGPLTEESTNQRFYKIENKNLIDITYKFINKIT